MDDEARRRREMDAALREIESKKKRLAKNRSRIWRLDVSLPKLAFQGILVMAVGVLVGLGAYVLAKIVFPDLLY